MERRGRPSSVYKLGLCLSLVTRLLLIAQTIQGLYHEQSNHPTLLLPRPLLLTANYVVAVLSANLIRHFTAHA